MDYMYHRLISTTNKWRNWNMGSLMLCVGWYIIVCFNICASKRNLTLINSWEAISQYHSLIVTALLNSNTEYKISMLGDNAPTDTITMTQWTFYGETFGLIQYWAIMIRTTIIICRHTTHSSFSKQTLFRQFYPQWTQTQGNDFISNNQQ